jgi:hypothetical protein
VQRECTFQLELGLKDPQCKTIQKKKMSSESDKKTEVTGFTLDADGVIKPAKGLELEFSRLFFKKYLRWKIIKPVKNPNELFNVYLRFDVSTGLFEAEICAKRQNNELIYSEAFPTCRSSDEAKDAFELFFEKTKNEIRSVQNCAMKCQEPSGSTIEV